MGAAMRDIVDLVVAELRGSWRFRWQAMSAAWLVCLFGWVAVYAMPDSYESEATVFVDTTSALGPLLEKLTVSTNVLQQVDAVTTIMLGRQQLEKVARDTGLYFRAGPGLEMDALISGLRERISISHDRRSRTNLYKIKYRDSEPTMARTVVTTLLNNFMEESLDANRQGTQKAQKFLRDELGDIEADLIAAEKSLADFKRNNLGRMPGATGDYFSRLQAEMTALEQTRSELRLANRRLDTLHQQLTGERPALDASSGPQTDLDRRIADNKGRLEELQLRFTDRHPDVIAVKAMLVQLEEQREEQTQQLLDLEGLGIISDNPVFQSIQIELANINVEIAALQEQEANQKAKIAKARGLVDILPNIEAELTRLNRDYGVKQAQYRSLLQRLEVAELSEAAELSEDVKFQVINPPFLPVRPIAPNRPVLLTVILLLGLGFGGALAFFANQLKPVFSDPNVLQQVIGLPILGTVSALDSIVRRRKRMAQVSTFSAALAVLCMIFVGVFWFHESGSRLLQSIA